MQAKICGFLTAVPLPTRPTRKGNYTALHNNMATMAGTNDHVKSITRKSLDAGRRHQR